jgi:hypothetical protein
MIHDVPISQITGVLWVGKAMQKGFVPKSGSNPPCTATQGDVLEAIKVTRSLLVANSS